tara:strand:- start:106 stop:1335 length:1230 start_codon:yes stop_codon:yes gene_type:complete
MKSIKNYLIYLALYNLSILLSYFFTYYQDGTYETNFITLGFSEIEFVLILNILTAVSFYVFLFLLKFESAVLHYLITFLSTKIILILFLWTIKFVNLSRGYILLNTIFFLIISVFITRILESSIDDTYISFEKELCDNNKNFYFTDFEKFPSDLMDLSSTLLKDKNLTGLVFSEKKIEKFSFKEIIEISNYFGINIYELKSGKFKLIHKSTSLNKVIKNLEDAVLVTLIIPIAAFLITFFAIILLIFDGRPIFYTQSRVGLNGKYFKIFKFRTMNNIELSADELKKLNKRDKIVFKAKNDPRITRLGSFYRKSSIDELPQVINVLKNEMSFVGPRPPIISEVKQYELKHLKRISVKPGITGLWQVSLRQDNNFDRWVEKDIEYIDKWSLSLDIKILFLTIKEIFNMTGD